MRPTQGQTTVHKKAAYSFETSVSICQCYGFTSLVSNFHVCWLSAVFLHIIAIGQLSS